MLQDIAPYQLRNPFDANKIPDDRDFVIFYQNHQMLVRLDETDGILHFPKIADFDDNASFIYLFSVGGRNLSEETYYLYASEKTDETGGCKANEDLSHEKEEAWLRNLFALGYTFLTVKKIGSLIPKPQRTVFAAYTGMHLAEWYQSKRFCGVCGKRLYHDTLERAMVCSACHKKYYPRINPAVIVGVKNGEQLLLTRYREGYRHNALIAGFCEIGETLEETVKREVFEETGLRVKNIMYYKSQPWGVALDLLAGFFCEVDGDTTIHMDETELRYAEWVDRDKIELQPSDYSLTNEMMRQFKEGKDRKKEG